MLYKEYCKLVSKLVVARAYRNYMEKMVDLGLVIAKGKGRWRNFQITLSECGFGLELANPA